MVIQWCYVYKYTYFYTTIFNANVPCSAFNIYPKCTPSHAVQYTLLFCTTILLLHIPLPHKPTHYFTSTQCVFFVNTDVDECAHTALRNCSPHAECNNTEASYHCTCRYGYTDVLPQNAGASCEGVFVRGSYYCEWVDMMYCMCACLCACVCVCDTERG